MNQPRTISETINAETARAYLATSQGDPYRRRIRREHAEKIARDILAGNWRFDGNAIAFDTNNVLKSGHHRMQAVLIAAETDPNVTIVTNVTRGVEPNIVHTANQAVSALPADVLHTLGYKNASDLGSSAILHRAWVDGGLVHSMSIIPPRLRFSHPELAAYVAAHPELVEAVSFASTMRRHLPLPRAAIAVAHAAFTQIDADDCHEYFARIRDLRTSGVGDPVATFVKRVNEDRASRKAIGPTTALYMLFRVWNAVRMGESLMKIQIGSALRGWAEMPQPK